MKSRCVQALGVFLVLGLHSGTFVRPAAATIQDDDLICWYPDVETPSGCDDEDD